MKSYSQLPSWHTYKALVEGRFGIALSREPKESSVPIRGHDIHVDTWEPDGPPHGTGLPTSKSVQPTQPANRIDELLPYRWMPLTAAN